MLPPKSTSEIYITGFIESRYNFLSLSNSFVDSTLVALEFCILVVPAKIRQLLNGSLTIVQKTFVVKELA